MSPTTSAIWAGMEPQRLGPVQQRGQAAMGVVTMKGGRYEHVPIRNYGPRPRDPQPQELPPRPQSQQVEETQSDGSFELVMELVDEEASAAGRQAQSNGYAAMVEMAMTLVEIDVLQKETTGQNLHRRKMKMRMRKTILFGSARLWASTGRGCSHRAQLDHQGTGTEAEDRGRRWTQRLARMQIYGKGLRPRQLFSGNQGGKGSSQSAPTLTGSGNTAGDEHPRGGANSKGHTGRTPWRRPRPRHQQQSTTWLRPKPDRRLERPCHRQG